MPVNLSQNHIIFPDIAEADDDGLLALGGNLEISTLLSAYKKGIFPWYSDEYPIMWWSPDPRMVLFPQKFILSKSLKHTLAQNTFEVKFDNDFKSVIEYCSSIRRKDQDDTWITSEMEKAYLNLHYAGFAHSVETYRDGKLAGGLYGVSLGKAFFGESMFFLQRDASKIALYHLVNLLLQWDFHFIDAQVETKHLKSLGAEMIPRTDFFIHLEKALLEPTLQGNWSQLMNSKTEIHHE